MEFAQLPNGLFEIIDSEGRYVQLTEEEFLKLNEYTTDFYNKWLTE